MKKWLKGAEEAYMVFLEQIKFLLGRRAQEGTGRVGASDPREAKGLSGDMIPTLSSVVDHGGGSVYSTTWVHLDEMPDRRFLGMFNVVLRKC
ncbi:hypothetical protein ALC57_18458 [Trachymyrmex cornetzi]|uniref:Uncharacterized protein n=1 Tax=Trachymyrmex cornetzi TaxID=471704 RepID=A0A151IRV8_9HYME|nr:hypothetical protein ALC57_18458 [Trachymyrmex cornetzi]